MNRIMRSENWEESGCGFAKHLALVALLISYEEWLQRGKCPLRPTYLAASAVEISEIQNYGFNNGLRSVFTNGGDLRMQEVVVIHGKTMEGRQAEMLPSLRTLQKSLITIHEDLSELCSSNLYMLQYISTAPSPTPLAPVTP
jgi:hypothetical protein